jgi:pimeloyl-ACP methyl ester carboxylesterase
LRARRSCISDASTLFQTFCWSTSTVIEDPRRPIDYDETGEGPTLVLVPGSCSTGAAWRSMISHWKGAFRCVTTSLLGHGGTAERRTADNADISREAEIIETVIRRAGAPVDLVGHSFGGLTGLAVALAQSHHSGGARCRDLAARWRGSALRCLSQHDRRVFSAPSRPVKSTPLSG